MSELTARLLEHRDGADSPSTDQPGIIDTSSMSSSGPSDGLTEPAIERVVYAKDEARNAEFKYPDNHISTAKYNLLTFFPKFLLEQFSRYANMFFLFTALVQQLPDTSPTGRWTTAGPLLVVLSLTAVKELLEDYKRHQADREVNGRLVKVFREGAFKTVRWDKVQVGDIVKCFDGEFFPADMMLLSSSEPDGMCYVETANLDGETNLKLRQALPSTLFLETATHVRHWQARIECEGPNNHLYKFVGNLIHRNAEDAEEMLPLGPDQLLQRGAQLRNTPWIYGFVVYTGHQSKLLKNATAAPIKRSNVDYIYNKLIIILFTTLVVLSFVSAIGYQVWAHDHRHKDWYIGLGEKGIQNPVLTFFTFIILYNNIIPISLIIQLDFVKYAQALVFINSDLKMYDENTDTPPRARTSALNEELGQVQYIFSDKTGTLTQNQMSFSKCSVGGIMYGDTTPPIPDDQVDPVPAATRFQDPALLDNLANKHETASVIREWLTALAVCHSVVPERSDDDPSVIHYQAASPDEAALVQAAKKLGFSFNVRKHNTVVINAMGVDEEYEVLNVLEFNSTRKRMSVIVRTPNNKIKLYIKGADDVIVDRLSPNQKFVEPTQAHLKHFATAGLRTLCIAMAQISEEEYSSWARVYEEATTSLGDRATLIDAAAEKIEKNMFLLGATAIEDKLQDDVPDTIRSLAEADIRIWVCTGDKQETAINIGYSCKLITETMTVLIANTHSSTEMHDWIRELMALHGVGRIHEHLAFVIDGHNLQFALDESVREDWLEFAQCCKAVIACRVSPLQKAEIVRLVRKRNSAITLAIGDGANDVGMIQAAHVGVGISGNEGLQAARAADYSIGQFKYLKRLLLVHGSWSYHRITKLILYSFYKNIALYLMELWFAFYNGFSGQILFEKWTIASFNVIFTLLPPIALGMFDQHVGEESLLTLPHLYKRAQKREGFNVKIFLLWLINAVYHSLLLFYLPFGVFGYESARRDGKMTGQWYLGMVIFSIVVLTVTIKAGLEMKHWTMWNHITVWLSIAVLFFYALIYCNLFATDSIEDNAAEVYGIDRAMFNSATFWLSLIMFPVLALFLDVLVEFTRLNFFPSTEDRVRYAEKLGRVVPTMPTTLGQSHGDEDLATPYSGYAFSQIESTARLAPHHVLEHADSTRRKPQG